MNSSVPPVIRGEFLFKDILFVDCGGYSKTHARASEAEIRRLLNGTEVKDQVAHWYEAQLIHYGLQRSKEKNTAKVRLQQALYQGKLEAQPPHLADMEAQMKKEYAALVCRASRIDSSKGQKGDDEDTSTKGFGRTKVSVTMDDISIKVERSSSFMDRFAPIRTNNFKADTEGYSSGTASYGRSSPSNQMGTETEHHSDSRRNTENVFQRSSAFDPHARPSEAPKPRKKQTGRKSAPTLGVKTEPKTEDQPDAQDELPIKAEPYDDYDQGYYNRGHYDQHDRKERNNGHESFDQGGFNQYNNRQDNYEYTYTNASQNQNNLTGIYTIDCPQLAFQSPADADNFRLHICVDNETGLIWGSFDLAWKTGVIKVVQIALNRNVSFGWRSRDHTNGGVRFGRGCFGEIEFFGAEQVRGVFHNLFPESMSFEGLRHPGPAWCGRSACEFEEEWEDYPREVPGSYYIGDIIREDLDSPRIARTSKGNPPDFQVTTRPPCPTAAQMDPMTSHENKLKTEAMIKHLEAVVRNCTASINDRTFENTPATPSWDYISPNFEVTHDTGSRPSTHTKAELLLGFQAATSEFPEFRLEIFNCTTEVDWGNGVGTVFVNAAESGGPGVPSGVMARKHIAVFEFKRDEEGRWMAVKEATIFGLGVDGEGLDLGMGGGGGF
ncbi:hypothetical protein PRZ48_003860 [Zasmidium cellare]|uniref:SnoaL-like domain-containing protein n=1 Tax=Zasmidium cellare TaxID=395010 RepID=A0ABR0EWU7_ZASCE|nr:hypothetical protein PRZ48_003860 [Zasmidium cellare]